MMFDLTQWEEADLLSVADECRRLTVVAADLMQAKRRERGAWAKPGLAGTAAALEKLLENSFHLLFKEIVASLRGQSDDVSSGRIAQAKRDNALTGPEVTAAMEYFGVPEEEENDPLDAGRQAAILVLLLLWKRRHIAIAAASVAEMYQKGREAALKAAGRPNATTQQTTQSLQAGVLSRYQEDIDALEKGIRDGTTRAYGVEWVLVNALTVGTAVAHLRRLVDAERFRLEMFAESLVWTAYTEGFRAGAVDATIDLLGESGISYSEGLALGSLTAEVLATLPHWVWSGPADEKACAPCLGRFGAPIVALTLDFLPLPETVCQFGRSCRHFWSLA